MREKIGTMSKLIFLIFHIKLLMIFFICFLFFCLFVFCFLFFFWDKEKKYYSYLFFSIFSFRIRYPYYLKTVPGLEDQMRAIIMILKNYGWNYTQVVYCNTYSEIDNMLLFKRLAAEAGICVVADYHFSAQDDPNIIASKFWKVMNWKLV